MNKIIIPVSIIVGLAIIAIVVSQFIDNNQENIQFEINKFQKQVDILKSVTEADQGIF